MTLHALREGDLVAVLAPAGPADPALLPAVEALYARHGLRVRLYPSCRAGFGAGSYLAGDDAARRADLHASLADDEVAALHGLRGGYGCMRLLDGIDSGQVRRAAKLLIGYSDITALHALWCHAGVPSLHAPMPASDLVKPGRGADEAALFSLLRTGLRAGEVLAPALDAQGLRAGGAAEGRLVGGNLSLVAALLGTPWAWPAAGAILFLEDINEELYRVDRLLTQLRLAGVLDAVAGFVLGSFTESTSPQVLLAQMLGRLGKPVLGGWPSGHGTPNRPLPLGLRVRIDAAAGTLEVREDFLPAK